MKAKNIKLSLTVVLLCLLFISCKKKIDEDYRPEFVGYWVFWENSDFIHLDIDKNSNAHYLYYYQGNSPHEHFGKARANDKVLKIGRTISIDIIEYPHQIDTNVDIHYAPVDASHTIAKKANWKMVLSGLHPAFLYLEGTYTYYKADY